MQPPEDNTLSDKEERKKEIEEKLKILNERKHKLVQVLKQVIASVCDGYKKLSAMFLLELLISGFLL